MILIALERRDDGTVPRNAIDQCTLNSDPGLNRLVNDGEHRVVANSNSTSYQKKKTSFFLSVGETCFV